LVRMGNFILLQSKTKFPPVSGELADLRAEIDFQI
jgi:hypothetical protein